jgi:hypothetical protein
MAERNLDARKQAGELVIRQGEKAGCLKREALRVMREWVTPAQFAPEDVYRTPSGGRACRSGGRPRRQQHSAGAASGG